MSRITRWKLEKTKTKVVFRLQFHATHIPQSGWDKLFVTFIPADSGKATAKTTKANVRNGTCKWSDPIYETTRLLQDVRTKQFDEKLYKFVISMGSSRSSLLGEATINLADYADALRPTSVSLPLHGCETILHVTVQLLTSKTGFREFELQRELSERGLLTTSDHDSHIESVSGRLLYPGDATSEHLDNSRINLKPSRKGNLSREDSAPNEDCVGSPIGFDGSSNTSESLYADKHDTASSQEVDTQSSDQKYHPVHGAHDWINSCGSEYCGDNGIASAYEENSRLRGSLDLAESSIHQLKLELSSLQGHSDELGVETQKFAQQLAAEMASGENLAREVAVLKIECSKFKQEIEVLKEKNNKLRSPPNCRESVGNIEESIYQELQVRWLKGLLFLEDKLQEFQEKACFRFDDMDSRVLESDLESMLLMLKDLKQGTGQVISSFNFVTQEGRVALKESALESNLDENEEHKLRFGLGTDLYQPEILHSDDITNSMKSKMDELMRELDQSKAEKEDLVRKMNQMECYYHALVQELEVNQRHMLGELQNLTNEHSACLYAVSSKNAEMERMRQDMNDKIILFTEEKQELDACVKEFERRATTSEAALKRARLNYSIAVGQLQKDLELLSSQVSSMYEANQNLIKDAFQDPEIDNPVRALKDQGFMQNKQSLGLGGEVLLDDLRRSLNLQEELYRKIEDEVRDMHHESTYLDILSLTLRGTLVEAISDIGVKINEKYEMVKQLGFYKKSNDVLMLRLQTTLDEVGSLNKEKAALSEKFYEINKWNEKLEANLRSAADENCCLMHKIAELESSLKKEIDESCNLKNRNVALQERLMNLTIDFQKLESEKETLEEHVSSLQEELQGLQIGHGKTVVQLTEEKENLAKEREMAHASLSISESAKENLEKVVCDLQQKLQTLVMCQDERLRQLTEEVEVLTKEKNAACASSSALESAKINLDQVVTDLRQKLLVLLMHHDKNFDGASFDIFSLVSQLGEIQDNAQQSISRLTVEADTLATERDKAKACLVVLESAKENLQKIVDNLREKLQDLLIFHHDNFEGTSLDLFDIVSQIGEHQHSTQQRISQLLGENEVLVKERDLAQASLSTSESEKENLRNFVSELQKKLQDLLMFHGEIVDGSSLNLMDILSRLEEFQSNMHKKIYKLIGDNEVLARERDYIKASLIQLQSDNHAFKEKSESDLHDVLEKINISDSMVQKLQLKLEVIADGLKVCLKDEGIYKDQLIADFDKLKDELEELNVKNGDLSQEIFSLQYLSEELWKSKFTVEEFTKENQSLKALLCEKTEESAHLVSELTELRGSLQNLNEEIERGQGIKEELENMVTDLTAELNETRSKLPYFEKERDLAQASLSTSESEKENLMNFVSELRKKLLDLLRLHGEIVDGSSLNLMDILSRLEGFQRNMHQKICKLIGDNEVLAWERDDAKSSLIQLKFDNHAIKEKSESDLRDVLAKINFSDSMVQNLLLKHEVIADGLKACLNDEGIYKDHQRMLIADLDKLKDELEEVNVKNGDLAQEIFSLQYLSEELWKSKLNVEGFTKENQSLRAQLCEKTEESAHLVSELTELRGSLQKLNEEIERGQGTREELEKMVTDLTAELNETHSKLPYFENQISETVHLRALVSELQAEQFRLDNLLLQKEECIKVACQETVSRNYLEDQLFEMDDVWVASDVQVIFIQSQYKSLIEDVVQQHKLSEWNQSDLHAKYLNIESRLNCALANEVQLTEENAELSRNLESFRAELEAATAQNRILSGSNKALALELEEYRNRFDVLDDSLSEESRKKGFEIEILKQRLASSEGEIGGLTISNEELKIELLVLKDALHEHCGELTLMEEEYKELSNRLSAQVLKIKELKNLSEHLKELKDKAEAECARAYKKKEAESPSFAMQESLRIAFIKEQYETTVQELKQQLLMSKKHSEEMLLKLQDAVDEIENRKRIESSNLRRNEELSMRILELESELQDIVSDKREKAMAYDCMKAEMECSLISLECCKEEKEKLEASLQQCCEEKSKIELELAQVKELLSEISPAEMSNGERRCLDQASSSEHGIAGFSSSPTAEIQAKQGFVSSSENEVQSPVENGDNFLQGEVKDIALLSDQLKVQTLRSSIDNLNKEVFPI
ncbi:hypothetical protein SAY86_001436 [Trapa natans]|uniref:C2 NT-type domain-containing protein n=1 Tax=Trapa natans TaxID=22666 RepID=A0AAN7M5G9_TRANT|nr:hypothetical protein SAY86_001436 [Trapa natans]